MPFLIYENKASADRLTVVYNIIVPASVFETEPPALIILFPVFFILSFTALAVLYHYKAVQTNTLHDKLSLLFSTTVPWLLFYFSK